MLSLEQIYLTLVVVANKVGWHFTTNILLFLANFFIVYIRDEIYPFSLLDKSSTVLTILIIMIFIDKMMVIKGIGGNKTFPDKITCVTYISAAILGYGIISSFRIL